MKLNNILSKHYNKTVVDVENDWEGMCIIHFENGDTKTSSWYYISGILLDFITD